MAEYVCQCCGFKKTFIAESQAFLDGWDTPERFGYTACNLCPGVCIVLGHGHEKAHAFWAENGRPDDFSVKTCGTDDILGNPGEAERIQAELAAFEAALNLAIQDKPNA